MNEHLDTTVTVPGAVVATGVLRYIGSISGKPGLFGGIELQGPSATSRGKNNGDVNGTQYFEVSLPKTGLFLPWERLVLANPHLQPSRVSSRRDTRTPTPTRRFSSEKEKKAVRSVSSGSDGTLLRQGSVRPSSRADSWAGSRQISLDKLTRKNDERNDEWKQKYELKCREFEQKEAILMDLQNTVDKLQPILEDYETSLDEKERKLRKQKIEYEKARDEWRQSLELMISSQQETENLYEMQVSDLKEELQHVKSMSDNEHTRDESSRSAALEREIEELHSKISELEVGDKVKGKNNNELGTKAFETEKKEYEKVNAELEERNAELEEKLAELERQIAKLEVEDRSEDLAESAELQLEKEQLEKKVLMLTQDVSSMEVVMEGIQAKLRAKESQIATLEIQLEDASQAGNLLREMESLSVEGNGWKEKDLLWKEKEETMSAKIAELEGKLKAGNNIEEVQSKLKMEKKEAENKLEKSSLKHVEMEKRLAERESEKETMEKQLKESEVNREKMEKQLKESEVDREKMEKQLKESASQVEELQKRMEQNSEQVKELQKKMEDALEKEETATKLLREKELLKDTKDDESELRKNIEDLKHELEMRPSMEELTELQTSLEDIDSLHQKEVQAQKSVLTSTKMENQKLVEEITELKRRLAQLEQALPEPTVTVNGAENLEWDEQGSLPIYSPKKKLDPSSGRQDWCGLCERDGHDSLHCPYENDIF